MAVVDEHALANLDIIEHVGPSCADPTMVADYLLALDDQRVAPADDALPCLGTGIWADLADADFGAGQIAHDCDGGVMLAGLRANAVENLFVLIERAVREVQSEDVYSGVDHPADNVRRTAGGTHRGYGLGLDHADILATAGLSVNDVRLCTRDDLLCNLGESGVYHPMTASYSV